MKRKGTCAYTLLFLFWAIILSTAQDKKPAGVDRDLQDKINNAIDRGVTWLKSKQKDDGSFELELRQTQYPEGATVLALLTLLKCGVSKDENVIKKGFEWLKKSSLYEPAEKSKTYCVAVLILALEAKYNSNEVVVKGTSAKGGGKGQKDDVEWMKRLHKWLLDNRTEYEGDAVVDEKGKTTAGGSQKVKNVAWSYTNIKRLSRWDNSNTQFAVLALEACSRVGITTQERIWIGIMNHFLSLQEKNGEKVKRVGLDTSTGTTTETEVEDEARGWAYSAMGTSENVYHSMTEVGIASLIICNAELQKSKSYKKRYSTVVEKGIRDGIAWLGENFPVKDDSVKQKQYNYTLYGLERVGALAKIENIGKHLWYKEGAEDIIDRQKSDGSWDTTLSDSNKGLGTLAETCFCLLFLSRGTFKVPGEGFEVETKR